MKRALLAICVLASGCVLGAMARQSHCERKFERQHKEQLASCDVAQKRHDDCIASLPTNDSYPYYRDGDLERCSEQFPEPDWGECYRGRKCPPAFDLPQGGL